MSPQASTAQQDNWWSNDPVYTGDDNAQGSNAAPASQGNASQEFYKNDPIYVPPDNSSDASSQPSTLADIGKSVVASGIPRGLAAIPMWAANVGNLAAHGEEYLAEQTHNAITGKPLTPEQQAALYRNPFYSSEDVLQGAAKATGLPAPYEPKTTAGKFADTATQFAVGAPAFGMSIPAAIASGVASEGAGELTKGTPLEPAARLIGAVGGNMGAGAAKSAIGTYAEPFTESGRQDIAANRYFNAAENPQTAGETLTNPPDLSTVPQEQVGVSQPTTAQVTQDPGLVRLQKQLEAQNPMPFAERTQEQEVAQNMALNIAPNGDPAEVGKYFTGQLQSLEAQGKAARDAAINNVAAQTESLGGFQNPQQYGDIMRQGLQEAYNASNANESALWKPLENYYSSPVIGSTVPDTVTNILTRVNPRGGQTITPQEGQIYNAVRSWQGSPTFGDLRDLRSTTTDAIRDLGDSQGYNSVPVMRLMGVKNAIDQSLENGVNGIVAREQQAVAAGHLAPDDTLAARYNNLQVQRELVRYGLHPDMITGDATPSQVVSALNSIENSTVSAGAGNSAKYPVLNFIRQQGGVRVGSTLDSELRNMGITPQSRPGLFKKTGGIGDIDNFPVNEWKLGAAPDDGHGYVDRQFILDKIGEELGGKRVTDDKYAPVQDNYDVDAERMLHDNGIDIDAALKQGRKNTPELAEIQREMEALAAQARGEYNPGYGGQSQNSRAGGISGAVPSGKIPGRGVEPPASASAQILSGWNRGTRTGNGRSGNAAGFSGIQAEIPQISGDVLRQYQAARSATQAQKSTFGGDIGDVLAPNKVMASDVPAKFFNDRSNSPEKIQAFIKAAGDRTPAVSALRDYAVSRLKADIINPDGTIDPAKFDRWSTRYKNTLDSFPELKAQLSNVRDAQATLDNTVAWHDANIEAFQRSRANMFLEKRYGGKDFDPLTAASRVFSSGNSTQAARELMRLTNGDKNAQAGLQRMVNDYIIRKIRGSLSGDENNIDLKNPRTLRQFLDTHRDALKVFYGTEGYNNLARVANETLRYDAADAMARNVKAPPEQISTYQWLKERLASHPTLSKVASGGAIGGVTVAAGSHLPQIASVALAHPVVGAMGIAAGLATAMRQARISSIDALVQKAALNPEFAAELFKTYGSKTPPLPAQRRLAAVLIKSIPSVAATYQEKRQAR